jgi:hypothetical protein
MKVFLYVVYLKKWKEEKGTIVLSVASVLLAY